MFAACVQKKFIVEPEESYTEPLASWNITVLPSANRKSAVVKAMGEPILD